MIRTTTPLNDAWDFLEGFEESYLRDFPAHAETVDLPHSVKSLPYDDFSEGEYQGIYTYRKVFSYAPSKGHRTIVHFSGAMLQFDLYLNGANLGHYISGYFPVEVELRNIKKGKNALIVVLDTREDKSIPPFGNVVDYLTYGGIYREVHLEEIPLSGHMENVYATASSSGELTLHGDFFGEGKLSANLFDEDHLVASFEGDRFQFDNPHLWSLENPHLYFLVVKYGEDQISLRIGFRDLVWKEDGCHLNGERKMLRGLNRHQSYPYFGYAAPASLQEEDARILKEDLGCEIVRTSHYADDESFLDACDALGLLVIDEIPGWQYVGQDEAWRKNCRDFARRLILKERKHPCLALYGLRIDESQDDHELYSSLVALQKELDPSRQCLGVRNIKDSELLEDVYGYNDFSCSSLSHGADASRSLKPALGHPLLISEHNGHMFPTKNGDPSSRRIEQALRHAKVLEDAYADGGYAACLGWCAFDYNTHRDFGSVDHICHHGVMDMFRLSKDAAYFYASQGEKPTLYVASPIQSGDFNAALLGETPVFTNADYVEFYKDGALIGKFYPDKKRYGHLPHPPIFLNDYIGERFEEKGISEKDKRLLIRGLNVAATQGMGALTLGDKIQMGLVMAHCHLSFRDLMAYYGKYIGSWGDKAIVYEIKAYKNGVCFASEKRGPSERFHLEASAAKTELYQAETYDAVEIKIQKKDEYGRLSCYASDALLLSVAGPIEIMGPSLVSLKGGQIGVYVRSLKPKGKEKAVLHVHSEREDLDFALTVE